MLLVQHSYMLLILWVCSPGGPRTAFRAGLQGYTAVERIRRGQKKACWGTLCRPDAPGTEMVRPRPRGRASCETRGTATSEPGRKGIEQFQQVVPHTFGSRD